MAETIGNRLKHAWNAFRSNEQKRSTRSTTDDPSHNPFPLYGMSHTQRPDRIRLKYINEKSIVSSVYNRIALDVASVKIQHVRLDENDRILDILDSGLNDCLTLDANLDQTGRLLIQDMVMSMFDEGVVAIVPVDTTIDPTESTSFEINSIRTGKVIEWYPTHVRVELYNENRGIRETLILPKKSVAIVENPFYAVMNEPNSTLKRLVRKLNILDAIDEQSGSGKLDLIIQLPYTIKSQAMAERAHKRRKEIEVQLTSSKYGIAYMDATEKVTQLNRPVENNLLKQIEYLTSMLYSQLGLTTSIFDGTADEKTMLNYINRTIEPLLASLTDEMKRKFLTKTARTQRQSIKYFVEPFRLVPVSELSDIADKFTRNEILSSNEVRAIIGYKPSDDPAADELRNKNLNQTVNKEESNKEPSPDVDSMSKLMDKVRNQLQKGDRQNEI